MPCCIPEPVTVNFFLLYATSLRVGKEMFTCDVSAPSALSRPFLMTVWLPSYALRVSLTSTPANIRCLVITAVSLGYLEFTSAATPETNAADNDVPLAIVYHLSGSASLLHDPQSP